MSDEEEKKKQIYKKWWFWLIILAIIIVISLTIIMGTVFHTATSGINEVALVVQNIDSEATVYISAGENTIVVEIPNYTDATKKNKEQEILKTIKNYANSARLSNYSKFVLCEKMNSDKNVKDYFLTSRVYELPSMNEIQEEADIYIDFVEYTKQTVNKSSSTNNSNSAQEKGEDITLTAGKYTVGTDIKPGKYDAIAQSGSGNFFVKGSDSVNEILSSSASKNTSYGYIDKYTNLMLKNGDTVELRSNLKVLLQAK